MAYIIPIIIVAGLLYLMVVTWVFYLAIMTLKRHRENLTTPAKFFAYPIIYLGLAVDVVFNVIAGSVFFLEPPKQLLFTGRVESHMHRTNWRGKLARWFCFHFLDMFDPDGKHCG